MVGCYSQVAVTVIEPYGTNSENLTGGYGNIWFKQNSHTVEAAVDVLRPAFEDHIISSSSHRGLVSSVSPY